MDDSTQRRDRDNEIKRLVAEIVKEHPQGIDKNELAQEVIRRFKKARFN